MRAYDKKWKELNYQPVTHTVGDAVGWKSTLPLESVGWPRNPAFDYISMDLGRYGSSRTVPGQLHAREAAAPGNGTRFLRFEWEVPDENPLVHAPLPHRCREARVSGRTPYLYCGETTPSCLRRRFPGTPLIGTRVRVVVDVPAALGEIALKTLLRDRSTAPKIIDEAPRSTSLFETRAWPSAYALRRAIR